MNAPMSIMMVCTKSVQITAVKPPVMVKRAAMARRIKIEMYRPASPCINIYNSQIKFHFKFYMSSTYSLPVNSLLV